MGVRAAFAVFLLFIAAVKADKEGVKFWRKEFTMTCPGAGTIKWGGEIDPNVQNDTVSLTMEYTKKGFYHCEYNEGEDNKPKKYYFYVQGKACENCFELDTLVFLMAIVVDILMTIGVMFIVYQCTKKKSPAGLTHASKPPPRSGGRGGPPVPSPDYEQLNHTRSHDTYSKVNRTG